MCVHLPGAMANTKGRTGAAKGKAVEYMRDTIINEEEVECNPRHEEEVSRYDIFVNESSAMPVPLDSDDMVS